ncbi:MAG: class I SAM-dependent methyltransferase [Fermentimonas sp.]|jgi:2-polyprenyl-3-methyl-5-hydroxy-6-metoxy-1,4-benzoquinol methylase
MSNITLVKCPVCDSTQVKKVLDVTDYFATQETFPLFDCDNCGFLFTNQFPSEEEIQPYYDSPQYISHSDTKKGLTNQLYHLIRKRMLTKKVNLISKYSAPNKQNTSARLLDIGCGTGYFLDKARTKGYEVSGIEKDGHSRDFAKDKFKLNINDEDALWNIETNSFDIVTLWHVLEHMQNLNKVVSKLNQILKPDGTLVLALPNHNSYDAQVYKKHWAAYDVPRHLWHFTPDTVEKLLKKHSFKIIAKRPMPVDTFYISLLSEKYKGSNSFKQYIKALSVGSVGYLRSLNNIAYSSSIIYIAKKS